MRKLCLLLMLCVVCTMYGQQVALTQGQVISLYEGTAPGMENVKYQEYTIADAGLILNVVKPTLTVYLPDPSVRTREAMVVCPGGGMCFLSWKDEGDDVARALAKQGITAFVLKYRTQPMYNDNGEKFTNPIEVWLKTFKDGGKLKEELMKKQPGKEVSTSDWVQAMPTAKYAFADATRAMQIVRSHAQEWNFDKVGIMGFSAGAITATYIALNHDATCRPDFAGIIYGGWNVPRVPEDACPLFMASPTNDVFTPIESQNLFNAWQAAKKPAELHYYGAAQHGFGVKQLGQSTDHWFDGMIAFMKDSGFLRK